MGGSDGAGSRTHFRVGPLVSSDERVILFISIRLDRQIKGITVKLKGGGEGAFGDSCAHL